MAAQRFVTLDVETANPQQRPGFGWGVFCVWGWHYRHHCGHQI